MQVHHIGYLIKRMNNALSAFEYLGYRRTGAVVYDEGRDAELCFLKSAGGVKSAWSWSLPGGQARCTA